MMSIREQLISMKENEMKEIVFSNGILKSTKEMVKNSSNEFEVHSFTEGIMTATLTLDQAVKYCEGKLNNLELEWT